MEVIFRVSENILIACIKGDIDHHGAAPLRNSVDKAMKAFRCKNLILDFSGVSFMDSAGIGVVLGRYKRLSKTSGNIYISGCSLYIEKLLSMAGVFTLISKADTYDEAVSIMTGREQLRMEV
ncbi:MAG: anti-sigma factor antagonist [Clostridiales bacterium]|nr:anti-sigma factor antagonist [Clostridiales bacterium]